LLNKKVLRHFVPIPKKEQKIAPVIVLKPKIAIQLKPACGIKIKIKLEFYNSRTNSSNWF
jgi:hypothetical protein